MHKSGEKLKVNELQLAYHHEDDADGKDVICDDLHL